MIVEAPKNARVVCSPSDRVIPLELLYTGTREGLNVWITIRPALLPQGTASWRLEADHMPPKTKIDVEVGWEGQQ